MEQLGEDPDIFHIPGDDTGPAGFGETWLRALRTLPNGGREAGHGADVALVCPAE
ncbi:hypothetical protein ABZ547_26320 [Streptomyces sparsogenes]|uniref:hypothetical protein n=1 Tax=Streptomyces sparsogenes TaxID=67365 RepID=UPI0033D1AF63